MINTNKYKRNSKILAAKSAIRRSINFLNKKTNSATTAVPTSQGRYHQKCIQIDQNKNAFCNKVVNKFIKTGISKPKSNYQTPVKPASNIKKDNIPKTPQTLPAKLYNLRKQNINPTTPNIKLTNTAAFRTPTANKPLLNRLQEKNSKTVNVLSKTPISIAKSRMQHNQIEQKACKTPIKHHTGERQCHSLKKIDQKTTKTPLTANHIVHRKLFATDTKTQMNSASKVASNIKTGLARARRSLGFLKNTKSNSKLDQIGLNSKIPRLVSKTQATNLVINKVETEIELFKQVAEILDKTEYVNNDDKVVALPIQALKILYETPNRDKIIKTIKRVSILQTQTDCENKCVDETTTSKQPDKVKDVEVETQIQEAKSEVKETEKKIELNNSIADDECPIVDQKGELEKEFENQNQIEIVDNGILINKTSINNKENDKRLLKMIDQQQQQPKSNLNRTSEIISPFTMHNVFKSQNTKSNEVLTPSGLRRIFRNKKQKIQNENLSPFGMKNLFKQHNKNVEMANYASSPYTMKNLFKHHQVADQNVGEITASPFAMKNLFKQHQLNQNVGNVNASPFTMKNLFKQHQDANQIGGDITASPFAMRNLFKLREASKENVGEIAASPFTMKNLFKQHQTSKENASEIPASPFTMRNLFKASNNDEIGSNENLSPIALKSLFRNKILKNCGQLEAQATPLSMKNLFKMNNKKQMQLNQNINSVLSPTVFNCMFENENTSSPINRKNNMKKVVEVEKTPSEKVEEICEKIFNQELDAQGIQHEIKELDNCALLSHIIELKQQVRVLEDFSEQLIHSVNETIDEIEEVEQMSIQYADGVEDDNYGNYEEVIISVDCITAKVVDSNNVVLPKVSVEENSRVESNQISTEHPDEVRVDNMINNEAAMNEVESCVTQDGVIESVQDKKVDSNNEIRVEESKIENENITSNVVHENLVVDNQIQAQVHHLEKPNEVCDMEDERVVEKNCDNQKVIEANSQENLKSIETIEENMNQEGPSETVSTAETTPVKDGTTNLEIEKQNHECKNISDDIAEKEENIENNVEKINDSTSQDQKEIETKTDVEVSNQESLSSKIETSNEVKSQSVDEPNKSKEKVSEEILEKTDDLVNNEETVEIVKKKGGRKAAVRTKAKDLTTEQATLNSDKTETESVPKSRAKNTRRKKVNEIIEDDVVMEQNDHENKNDNKDVKVNENKEENVDSVAETKNDNNTEGENNIVDVDAEKLDESLTSLNSLNNIELIVNSVTAVVPGIIEADIPNSFETEDSTKNENKKSIETPTIEGANLKIDEPKTEIVSVVEATTTETQVSDVKSVDREEDYVLTSAKTSRKGAKKRNTNSKENNEEIMNVVTTEDEDIEVPHDKRTKGRGRRNKQETNEEQAVESMVVSQVTPVEVQSSNIDVVDAKKTETKRKGGRAKKQDAIEMESVVTVDEVKQEPKAEKVEIIETKPKNTRQKGGRGRARKETENSEMETKEHEIILQDAATSVVEVVNYKTEVEDEVAVKVESKSVQEHITDSKTESRRGRAKKENPSDVVNEIEVTTETVSDTKVKGGKRGGRKKAQVNLLDEVDEKQEIEKVISSNANKLHEILQIEKENEEEIVEELTESQSKPSKKQTKRGKKQIAKEEEAEDNLEQIVKQEAESELVDVPKKRGRRIQTKETEVIVETNEHVEDHKTLRKRGGRKAQAKNEIENKEESIEIVHDEHELPKKRGGRRAQAKIEVEEIVNEELEKSDVPKKKSRPKPVLITGRAKETIEAELAARGLTKNTIKKVDEVEEIIEEKPKSTAVRGRRAKVEEEEEEVIEDTDVITSARSSRRKNVETSHTEDETKTTTKQQKTTKKASSKAQVVLDVETEEEEEEKVETEQPKKGRTNKRKNSVDSVKDEEQMSQISATGRRAATRGQTKKLKT